MNSYLQYQPEDREPIASLAFDEFGESYRVSSVEAAMALYRQLGIEHDEPTLYSDFDSAGDELFWAFVADDVIGAGYEVYDGDQVFEVYERGTR